MLQKESLKEYTLFMTVLVLTTYKNCFSACIGPKVFCEDAYL